MLGISLAAAGGVNPSRTIALAVIALTPPRIHRRALLDPALFDPALFDPALFDRVIAIHPLRRPAVPPATGYALAAVPAPRRWRRFDHGTAPVT
ncbi:hypothetical protein GCM10011512_04140 [Tersicoccus solisilvae]|uniref:Uncharacterized protein n=1 Tax=Tersicoccus solisilvae TaxID=1882339 RepID=A0ABQ1NM58_9MICC|nr:hypothetical protein [Tersicoccus solisilvae]GGC80555.1 hypothetical protein GCM10011512_04140 [Tersicoccus solisilvae]